MDQNLIMDDRLKLVDEYNTKIRELKSEISEIRKEGKDPLIADFLLRNVSSKIEWAVQNGKKSDFMKIKEIFELVKSEIEDAHEKEIMNVKKEVMLKFENLKKEINGDEQISKLNKTEKTKDITPVKTNHSNDKKHFKPVGEIVIVDPAKCFYLRDGTSFNSISALLDGLVDISQEDYDYHTRPEHKDFGLWLERVLGETELAKKIKVAINKQEMISILVSRLRGE